MNPHRQKRRRRKQAGYTLLMVVFMVASMLIVAMAAVPSILTQGRREKEEEMVWRGKQYQRAIGLYYRKFGRYPTKVDDLVKQTNGVRFLRQAYTDPMNKEDGSWRFIYVGPSGQLIGSLRATSLQQLSMPTLGPNGALTPNGGTQQTQSPFGPNQGAGTGQIGGQANPASAPNSAESQPQPLTGDVLGGNIIGVGSKIQKPSIRVYLGGDTYEMWEFIWNPTQGLVPGQIGIPGQTPGGVNPNGGPNQLTPGTGGTNPLGGNGLQGGFGPQGGPGGMPPPSTTPTQ
jgi:type II secretory pathway pseudopilin PulG